VYKNTIVYDVLISSQEYSLKKTVRVQLNLINIKIFILFVLTENQWMIFGNIPVLCSARHEPYGFYAALEHVTLNLIRELEYLCTREDDVANVETCRDNYDFKWIPRSCLN
jgi:hypothetical protein